MTDDDQAPHPEGAAQDLARAQQALRANQEHLRRITDATPALIAHLDADGRFTFANRHCAAFFGRTPETLVGARLEDVFGDEPLDLLRPRIARALDGEEVRFEAELPSAAGELRFLAITYTPDAGSGGLFVTAIDVTELELINATLRALASELRLERVLQTVTDATTRLTGAKFGAFFYNRVDENGERYQLFTLSGAERAAFERLGMPRHTPLFGPTFRGEAVVRCADVLLDPRYGRMPPHHGMPPGHLPVRSYLAIPVVSLGGEVLGGLFFGHPAPGMFTDRAERLVCGVASQAAAALDNARLYEATRRAAEERRELLESERAARAEAVRTSRLKDAFLATVSHELRTPLTSILGWAHVLLGRLPPDATELRHGLEAIERNARAQARLIEDLLDIGRIEAGKVRLDVQRVDPASFVEAAVDAQRPAAEAKGLHLDRVFEGDLPPVHGDPTRLQQIVANLVSNAVKFTPAGGRVEVRVRQASGQLEIEVRDTGAGIDPEFLPHLFERFQQANADTTRRQGGLGLGLAIVKQLVELHGGTVHGTSPGLGQGSLFRVELPLPAADEPGVHPCASSGLGIDLAGVSVLVVDDEPDAREVVARLLAGAGARVVQAGSAQEALAKVERDPPDAVVSDIGMPEVDGYELARRLRAFGEARGRPVPAIALTALAQPKDRARALRAGYRRYLAKPIEPAALLAAVASVTGRTRSPDP